MDAGAAPHGTESAFYGFIMVVTDAPPHSENKHKRSRDMRRQNARVRDGFGLFFLIGVIGWSGASWVVSSAFHLTAGAVVAAVVAFGCTVAMRRALWRRNAARIRAIMTTPQEFPAIPLPTYLIPYISPLYEAEIAAG
jgi:hypothetical protein